MHHHCVCFRPNSRVLSSSCLNLYCLHHHSSHDFRVLRMENTEELEDNQSKEIHVEKENREEMLSRHRYTIFQGS